MPQRKYDQRCEDVKDVVMLLFAGVGMFIGIGYSFEFGMPDRYRVCVDDALSPFVRLT